MANWNDYVALEQNFVMPLSFYEAFEKLLAAGDKEAAIEYMQAICRYNFYGQEYEGTNQTIELLLDNMSILIDQTKIKYHQASKGGRGNSAITDEELLELWESGQYKSKAELGRAFGITGQAVGQRLKRILSKQKPKENFESESVPQTLSTSSRRIAELM